ncbi:MAG: AIR synthase family protein [Desulfurococcales archaeon]|nr:AIR synthase family protein [Desulfurococcales archaeon]
MRERGGRLPIGKLPLDALGEVISRIRTYRDPQTTQGPAVGEDAGIIRLPCCDLAIHSDPITEASSLAGRLSIIVASNDVATTGACPRWASITIMIPPNSDIESIKSIAEEAGSIARDLGIDVISGHTEISPGLAKPILVTTVIGLTCPGCAIRTGDARPGDIILITGYAGTEGTAILATDFRDKLKDCGVSNETLEGAKSLGDKVSIVGRACALASKRLPTAMHDATEGGVIGALVELALASNTRVVVYAERIPVHPSTTAISNCLDIDYLKLISSGALIFTAPKDKVGDAVSLLKTKGYPVEVIGRVEEGEPELVLYRGERVERYSAPPADEISRVWERYEQEKERESR